MTVSVRLRILLTAVLLSCCSVACIGGEERLPAASKRENSTGVPLLMSVAIERSGVRWLLSNDQLEMTLDPQAGALTVLDKVSRHLWTQAPPAAGGAPPRFRDVREVELPGKSGSHNRGIAFEADFPSGGGASIRLVVTLTLSKSGLIVDADSVERETRIEHVPFLDPLVLDCSNGAILVPTDGNGQIYPLESGPVPWDWYSVGDMAIPWVMDMPWVGVCDLDKGFGYAVIVDTPDDAAIGLGKWKSDERELWAPRVAWIGSKGAFRHPRRLTYEFAPSGGYVALAKRYREYARDHGLLVTLAEKRKKNPNVARLYGAPDVWDNGTLEYARAAKAAGAEKMLMHGRAESPEDMKAINDLGYLTSCYDNYTDILPLEPGQHINARHDILPDHAVLQTDGERMSAWRTLEETQYMKRCPEFWVPAAKATIPKVLSRYPYLGRFIDVTPSEGLYECYDPKHPLTRGEKRQRGVDLLEYVHSLGLVVGGEHGRWWAVPHLEYFEGMMSGGSAAWPAGYLIRPKAKDDPAARASSNWEEYDKFGIGHERRVPLWELVFHDCVVTTWYWGDSSDFLLVAAPEVTPKKDAFNILYGTIPMMWSNDEGSWVQNREMFMRTYRNTCKVHEAIAETEMLSHEFVTADRAVQRTRFSDGTEVVVNFGEKPREVEVGGKKHLLPQNGFAVKGPRVEQSLAIEDGRAVTRIKASGYSYSEPR